MKSTIKVDFELIIYFAHLSVFWVINKKHHIPVISVNSNIVNNIGVNVRFTSYNIYRKLAIKSRK